MSPINLQLDKDLLDFATYQANQRGYKNIQGYLIALLREAKAKKENGVSKEEKSRLAPWEIALQISTGVPSSEWEKVPSDLSQNIDHYLYGRLRED